MKKRMVFMLYALLLCVAMIGKVDSQAAAGVPEGYGRYASFGGYDFYRNADSDTVCFDSEGNQVINEFKCDGTYTYFFQADGTAMRDRLSYHPDGAHVIYFDSEGHEIFSDFAHVKTSIAGTPVDDYCFFDVYGFMYVDVLTYDKTGNALYYANPYGVMEMGKWFQFSGQVKWADGTPAEGIAEKYGYAMENGTLMADQWTYDWNGRLVYLQGIVAANTEPATEAEPVHEHTWVTVTDAEAWDEPVYETRDIWELHSYWPDGTICDEMMSCQAKMNWCLKHCTRCFPDCPEPDPQGRCSLSIADGPVYMGTETIQTGTVHHEAVTHQECSTCGARQ